jgi:hypothetical protein
MGDVRNVMDSSVGMIVGARISAVGGASVGSNVGMGVGVYTLLGVSIVPPHAERMKMNNKRIGVGFFIDDVFMGRGDPPMPSLKLLNAMIC